MSRVEKGRLAREVLVQFAELEVAGSKRRDSRQAISDNKQDSRRTPGGSTSTGAPLKGARDLGALPT